MDDITSRRTIYLHMFGMNVLVGWGRYVNKELFGRILKCTAKANATSAALKKLVPVTKADFGRTTTRENEK